MANKLEEILLDSYVSARNFLTQEKVLHTFEAGRRGKPDEIEGALGSLIGALLVGGKFDLRIAGSYQDGKPKVRVSGEISEHLLNHDLRDNIVKIIVDHYNKVRRTSLEPKDFIIIYEPKPQASLLAQNGNAGDSGNAIAVAYKNTPNNLPWERFLAVAVRDIIDYVFQHDGAVPRDIAEASKVRELVGLKDDGKVRFNVRYKGTQVYNIPDITIAAAHEQKLPVEILRERLERIVLAYLSILQDAYKVDFGKPVIKINQLGAWNKGGWEDDEGNREAKPYRDAFSSHGAVGDSIPAEDFGTKEAGVLTFTAWNIAQALVINGLAHYAKAHVYSTIGEKAFGLNVTTNGASLRSQSDLENWVRKNVPFGIKPARELFRLLDPALYRQIALSSDFFQDPTLPWNLNGSPKNGVPRRIESQNFIYVF